MDSLTELYCLIDDFCRAFESAWEWHLLATRAKRRQRPSLLSLPELMTLAILFHQLRFRQFKPFYLGYVCRHLRAEFPKLPSYTLCGAAAHRWRLCSITSRVLRRHCHRRCHDLSGLQ
jgi:hypothetical protein